MARKSIKQHRKAFVRKLRREFTKKQQKWISEKIHFLVWSEGKSPKAAAGQAYGMARQKYKKTAHRKGRR